MNSYEKRFAANLQQLRTRRGLSQRQLGELIGFSDKTVSKWECGGGIPDIPALYRMAELFRIRLDDFFVDSTVYYLGIDGGSTKTTLCLADRDLNVLRQERIGCTNPVDIGIDAATQALRDGIRRICQGIPMGKIAMFAGIAGGISANYQDPLMAFFKEFGFLTCESDTDNRSIIAAGLGNANGISVIMGTGICVFSQKDGVRRRFSGWGYLFDNGGSAYNVGREGLAAFFEALDGHGKQTIISDMLPTSPPDVQQLLAELYSGGKKEVASYAHVVYAAAREKDEVAIAILKRNMGFAARLIEAASAQLTQEKIPVVLTGELTAQKDTLDYLREALTDPERYHMQILSFPPVYGALLLAKELAEQTMGEEGHVF